jgi:energy-coupling factor transport system ATP-binding protein
MEEAACADRIIVINDGEVYMQGTPKEIFSRISELHVIGLEAPQGTELINTLVEAGCDLPAGCVSEEECVRTLVRYYKEHQA